jgi:hypothetical protein
MPSATERQYANSFFRRRAGNLLPAKVETAAEERPGDFQEHTPHERLLVETPKKEGEEFLVEAVVSLDSIDSNAAVRTIVSRWSGGKESVESFGWSLGVTGEKSRFKPRNLILQMVGEDENSNIAYEVVPSNIRMDLGHRHHVCVKISLPEHRATFEVLDLDNPKGAVQKVSVSLGVRSKLMSGSSGLVIGGLGRRTPPHHWDGRIEALRILSGGLSDSLLDGDFSKWREGLVRWTPMTSGQPQFQWTGSESRPVEPTDMFRQAMGDLCQVLLNMNEFFYLH